MWLQSSVISFSLYVAPPDRPRTLSLTQPLLQAATSVRLESILTSLVFEQMLRIRVKAESSPKVAEEAGGRPTQGNTSNNLYGKLNNLVSSDLANVTGGRDFLLVGESLSYCFGPVVTYYD